MSSTRRLLLIASGAGSFAAPPFPSDLIAMFNGGQTGNDYQIGQATSSDGGLTWTEDAGNPVISKAGAGWVSAHVKDPWLMPDGLSAYVSGYAGSHYQIGRVTRPDTSSSVWSYDSTTTPAIAVGGAGSPDEHGCAFPTVLYEPADTGKEYKVWYRGADGAGKETVCYAYSSNADLSGLTKVGRVIDVGAAGSWYDVGIGPGGIAKVGTTYYLLVAGRQNVAAPVRWQGGCFSFTDPEGTYTASLQNPTLRAVYGTAGMSQVLTANTNAGSAIVEVGSTADWAAGWPMIIVDNNSESEIHCIASVESGTEMTLDATVTATFATGNGATIRPVEYNSLWPRSILRGPGGYRLFITPFQPQDDLNPGGTKLREMSMIATGSALDWPWTIDHATGLLFPLYPATTGWHKFSAENPSVIVAP